MRQRLDATLIRISIFLIAALSYGISMGAENETKAPSSRAISVRWYEPKMVGSPVDGVAPIIISGETFPKAVILIRLNQIIQIKRNTGQDMQKVSKECTVHAEPSSQAKTLETLKPDQPLWVSDENVEWVKLQREYGVGYLLKECLVPQDEEPTENPLNTGRKKYVKATADAQGYFEFTMNLPYGLVQVPIKIYKSRQEKRILQILVEVDSNGVNMHAKVHKKESKNLLKPFFWIEGGVGINSQSNKQTQPNLVGNAEFAGSEFPSYRFQAGWQPGMWGLSLSYQSMPGHIEETSSQWNLINGSFSWNVMALEGRYLIPMSAISQEDRLTVLFGVQRATIPFVEFDTSNGVTIPSIALDLLEAGVDLEFRIPPRWRFDVLFLYLYPLSSKIESASVYSAQANNSFELTMGGFFYFTSQWAVGGFWRNQMHSYNFEYRNTAGVPYPGNQSNTFSFFETLVRYTY